MSNVEILSYLFKDYENFMGLELFKNLLNDNNFKSVIIEGIKSGNIMGFSASEFICFKAILPEWFNGFSLYDGFLTGTNIDKCALFAEATSYLYDNPVACIGQNKYIDTKKEHIWIKNNNLNIDTSLLIKFPDTELEKLGYQINKKVNFSDDFMYEVRKEKEYKTSLQK